MSVRLLRKVLQEKAEEQPHEIEEESDSHSSPDSRNPFDLLDEEEQDQDDQDNESSTAEGSLTERITNQEANLKSVFDAAPTSNRKYKKKKKRKGKEDSSHKADKAEKPLDLLLETLSVDTNASNHQPSSTKSKASITRVRNNLVKHCTPSVLAVDPKFLSAENELKRIFGSKVVSSFENNNQAGSSRQIRGGRRGTHNPRKTILVSPSDHWPRWDGSISMELVETKEGKHYFRYIHTSSYSQAQSAFEAAKAVHDLNGIASTLLHHPYHLDSLITMAEFFKFSGEHQMASDAITKCLYALECAWHPLFTPLHGNCQLKYVHETNKPFFTALFIHMKNMDRRGCHRSALEVCKLLLSLDSDDPMGAIFCIDYFSLRAEEYAWLERFSEEYKSDNSLWLFPNFSYSLAICRFYLEPSKNEHMEREKATSLDLMKQALMLHPLVLKKLVAKVPLKDKAWADILKNPFFKSDKTGSPSLDHLINIYVERSYIIWRLPDLQKLLRDAAIQMIQTLEVNTSDAMDWACVRKEAFSSNKNEYSHLLVMDFSDSVSTMPLDNMQNFMIDPMMGEGQNWNQVANPVAGGDGGGRGIANRNPLAVLFESLLPWVDYGGREEDMGGGEHNLPNNDYNPENDETH